MKDYPFDKAALIVMTPPQFQALLNGVLDEKLKPLLAVLRSDSHPAQAEYLTTKQTLEFVHLSKPTLNKLRREGRITALNSSDKRVLYKRSELVAYLESTQKGGAPIC